MKLQILTHSRVLFAIVTLIALISSNRAVLPEEIKYNKKILLVDIIEDKNSPFQLDIHNLCEPQDIEIEILDENVAVSKIKNIQGKYLLILLRSHSTCYNNVT